MRKIEKQARWLREQRGNLCEAVSSLTKLITIGCLSGDRCKYHIQFDMGMSGENIILSVYICPENYLIEKIEYWCMGMILDEGCLPSVYFDQTGIEKRVKEFLSKIEEMKECVTKYLKLNEAI